MRIGHGNRLVSAAKQIREHNREAGNPISQRQGYGARHVVIRTVAPNMALLTRRDDARHPNF